MLEMPDGITTSEGNWYRTTAKQINTYLPGLLKQHRLEKIIKQADAWVKSPEIFGLISFVILVLVGISPLFSFVTSLLVYFLFYVSNSAIVSANLSGLIQKMNNDGFLYLLFGGALIYFSFVGPMTALFYGAILLFLYKVGLLRILLKFIGNKINPRKIPHSDRVLNMLLIRYGMKEGIQTPNIQHMENQLFDVAYYHKNRKK